jgi:hypothetical protein
MGTSRGQRQQEGIQEATVVCWRVGTKGLWSVWFSSPRRHTAPHDAPMRHWTTAAGANLCNWWWCICHDTTCCSIQDLFDTDEWWCWAQVKWLGQLHQEIGHKNYKSAQPVAQAQCRERYLPWTIKRSASRTVASNVDNCDKPWQLVRSLCIILHWIRLWKIW